MTTTNAHRSAKSDSPRISVVIPTFNAGAYLERALASLQAQMLLAWEAIIVDDGSTDETAERVGAYLADPRYSYRRLDTNRGLGAALNVGLESARAPSVSYLPADDVFYPEHLASLVRLLESDPHAVLAFAFARHHGHTEATEEIPGVGLQLVQVAHRRTADRWLERSELVTDDLEVMLWSQLRRRGGVLSSGLVSCEWVDHPAQRHKVIRESFGGGVNPYRVRYGVSHPLRFQSSEGAPLDEVELYRRFRERPDTPPGEDGLRIILVGELAYNPERVLALEERGHRLFGLWTPDGIGFNSVGAPFGHVQEIPREGWVETVRRLRPDVIYALLNWQAIPFAHHVLEENPGVPFVWHFKESPFAAIERGLWPQLADLHLRSAAQVYSSPELRDWYEAVLPGSTTHDRVLILDGDLPKHDWFAGERTSRLSESDGHVHTVCAGRPFGLFPDRLAELARWKVHTHFYGTYWGDWWRGWIEEARRVAPKHIHFHSHISQPDWLPELSRYDAAWLHAFQSRNGGDIRRAQWDDLNYPARIGTYAAAGLPLLQPDHGDSIVATQTLVRALDVGIFLRDPEGTAALLHDGEAMEGMRTRMWNARESFTFDAHADRLIDLFRRVTDGRKQPDAVRRTARPRVSAS